MEAGSKASVSPPRWTGLHSEYSPPKAGQSVDGDPGTRSETRRPHLVNYGASRLSTTVSFVPLPEHGRLVIGLPDRVVPPDLSIQGMGVERGHAVLESDGSRVLLRPQADMTTVDGIRCTGPVQLTSGCMLCFGRSHYFKYICPVDYQSSPALKDEYLTLGSVPALDNPEYYHMSAEADGGRDPCSGRPPPPKPPRQSASDGAGFVGEYLYTRLERPPGPAPAARVPAPAGARPSPYDNVPFPGRRAPPPADAAMALTEEQLTQRRRQEAAEERDQTEALQQLEQSRLDEILSLCAEYDSQMSSPQSPASRPPDSPAPVHNRIKTNGSLPRDRRLGSPGPVTPPEARRLSSAEEPPAALRSPYENVCFAAYPQSPRTRIRTTLQRERHDEREPSPPAGAVYMVPPPPVPLPPSRPADRHSLQFENKEYMRGLPLDTSFQQDDLIFLPAVGGGAADTSADGESLRTAVEHEADRLGGLTAADDAGGSPRVSWRDELEPDGLARLSRSFSDTTDDERETCRRLKDQRRMTYRQLSDLRQQKLDLEHQESEAIRQLEVEHALLEGEVADHDERLLQLEQEATALREALAARTDAWEHTRRRRQTEADELASRIMVAEAELERLEQLSEQFRGSTDDETRLLEKLKYQHELVEQERKSHEDQEFHHMEDQVGWEAEKEESLRQIHQLETRIASTRAEMESVRDQQRSLIESIRSDAEKMEQQRKEIVKQMCQERDKLKKTQRRLSSLSQSGVDGAADDPGLEEPDVSSDPEEFSNNEYIESRLAQLHILDKSRDDLQRIQNVTASAPIQVDNRSSSTLREIERNRHVLLAKQGSQVIEDERRRLEELKRRVQDEVTAQWQERRRHEQMRPWAGSAGSDESPDSAASCDSVAATAARVTNGHKTDEEQPRNSAPTSPPAPVNDGEGQCRPISTDVEDPKPRPVSDASSVFDGVEEPVRRRNRLALSPQQRPLTRYLPITDQQFDLRQHVESAGHQLEVCPLVFVTRHACRGYLHKLSSRFRSWQKRWFVFDRNRHKRTFMYYSDKSETKTKGGVYFQAIEEVYVDHLKTGRGSAPNTTFCVKTMSRTFHLMAPSPEAMRIWVDVIMTGAEGHAAFGQP